tara:strand:+ start:172 stop:630 length:459 start_codon:yes stop_codon:yes gene_type:complete
VFILLRDILVVMEEVVIVVLVEEVQELLEQILVLVILHQMVVLVVMVLHILHMLDLYSQQCQLVGKPLQVQLDFMVVEVVVETKIIQDLIRHLEVQVVEEMEILDLEMDLLVLLTLVAVEAVEAVELDLIHLLVDLLVVMVLLLLDTPYNAK